MFLDLQMSIKRPISKTKREQEAAAHLDRSGFYLLALMVGTQCSAYLPVFCTQQHQTQTPTLTL